jgi:hypothetical protein
MRTGSKAVGGVKLTASPSSSADVKNGEAILPLQRKPSIGGAQLRVIKHNFILLYYRERTVMPRKYVYDTTDRQEMWVQNSVEKANT